MNNKQEQIKYIGGEIEITDSESTVKNLGLRDKYSLYTSGRTAIVNILKTIQPQYTVLLPSYLCESIIQPFKTLGFNYSFYKINIDLSIDHDFLINKIEETRCSAIYYINFMGFMSDLDIRQIKEIDNDIVFIEDCTHSTFIPNEVNGLKNTGDIVFGSLRKTLPVSDGAYILNSNNISSFNAQLIDTHFSDFKKYGKTLRSLFLNNRKLTDLESIYLNILSMAEYELNREIPNTQMSESSFTILEHLNLEEIYSKRRSNYKRLYDYFLKDQNISQIGYPLKNIADNEMPYMLPFFVSKGNRNELRENLRDHGIFTAVIWAIIDEVDPIIFEESYNLSNNILCFPIDQRYLDDDMYYLISKFKQIVQNKK